MKQEESGGFLFKTGLFALLAGIAYFFFNKGAKPDGEDRTKPSTELPVPPPVVQKPAPLPVPDNVQKSYISEEIFPRSTTGEIVHHGWYALSYAEDHEQAEWVVHEIRQDRLNENWAARPNSFRPDFDVRTESATPRDYNGSGYDRGHLCPAADMGFDEQAMDETFLMSNMSPQVPAFNAGVWRELEELSRDWGRKFKKIYVVTGPVLTERALGQIGQTRVTVPARFYKVLYAPDQHRAIAFVLPNAVSNRPVMDYACSIDEVEKVTGMDFFPKLLNGLNEELEGSFDPAAWPIDRLRESRRIKEWNKQ
jgi:endonuclease G